MTTENWRMVPNYENIYCVSDLGNFWSCDRVLTSGKPRYRKEIKPWRHPRGYLCVGLAFGGVYHKKLAHRIVLEAFVGPCPEGMEACHNNGNRADNRLSNLRWDTPTANNADKLAHQTQIRGGQVHNAKLTDRMVREIKHSLRAGQTGAQLAKCYGVSVGTISHIRRNKTWRHVAL